VLVVVLKRVLVEVENGLDDADNFQERKCFMTFSSSPPRMKIAG